MCSVYLEHNVICFLKSYFVYNLSSGTFWEFTQCFFLRVELWLVYNKFTVFNISSSYVIIMIKEKYILSCKNKK